MNENLIVYVYIKVFNSTPTYVVYSLFQQCTCNVALHLLAASAVSVTSYFVYSLLQQYM
jgi:hypothetical protein